MDPEALRQRTLAVIEISLACHQLRSHPTLA